MPTLPNLGLEVLRILVFTYSLRPTASDLFNSCFAASDWELNVYRLNNAD
jgi:hypothetical protein